MHIRRHLTFVKCSVIINSFYKILPIFQNGTGWDNSGKYYITILRDGTKYLRYFQLRILQSYYIRPSPSSTPTFKEFDQGLWVWRLNSLVEEMMFWRKYKLLNCSLQSSVHVQISMISMKLGMYVVRVVTLDVVYQIIANYS